MFALRIEQRPGARVVASKLLPLSEVRSASTRENVRDMPAAYGSRERVVRLGSESTHVLANSGEFKGYEIESSGVVASLLDMVVASVLFIVNEPSRGEERTWPGLDH